MVALEVNRNRIGNVGKLKGSKGVRSCISKRCHVELSRGRDTALVQGRKSAPHGITAKSTAQQLSAPVSSVIDSSLTAGLSWPLARRTWKPNSSTR